MPQVEDAEKFLTSAERQAVLLHLLYSLKVRPKKIFLKGLKKRTLFYEGRYIRFKEKIHIKVNYKLIN
jgi:hypothetical protein